MTLSKKYRLFLDLKSSNLHRLIYNLSHRFSIRMGIRLRRCPEIPFILLNLAFKTICFRWVYQVMPYFRCFPDNSLSRIYLQGFKNLPYILLKR